MPLQLLPEYIDDALKLGVSQLFFSVGCPVSYKNLEGELKPLSDDATPLSAADVEALVLQNAINEQRYKEQLAHAGEVEVSLSYPGKMRGRVNAYLQRSTYAMTITILSGDNIEPIKPLEDWGLPLSSILDKPSGALCIITSSPQNAAINLAASLVDYYNRNYACHIHTLEDKITTLHQHKMSIVNQRELSKNLDDAQSTIGRLHNLGADVCMLRSALSETIFRPIVELALSEILVIAVFDKTSLSALRGAVFAGLPSHDANDLKKKLLKLNCLLLEPENNIVMDCKEWLTPLTSPSSSTAPPTAPASATPTQIQRRVNRDIYG